MIAELLNKKGKQITVSSLYLSSVVQLGTTQEQLPNPIIAECALTL